MKAIVTVVGKDQVGIIARVCVKLAEYNVNVLDINQTVMQGYFTMMMAVDVSACTVPLAELVEIMEALVNYASHPLHLEAKEHFWHLLDSRVAADYEF